MTAARPRSGSRPSTILVNVTAVIGENLTAWWQKWRWGCVDSRLPYANGFGMRLSPRGRSKGEGTYHQGGEFHGESLTDLRLQLHNQVFPLRIPEEYAEEIVSKGLSPKRLDASSKENQNDD